MDGWMSGWDVQALAALSHTLGKEELACFSLLPSSFPFPRQGLPSSRPTTFSWSKLPCGSREGLSPWGSFTPSALPCTSPLPGHLHTSLGCQPGVRGPKPTIVPGRGRSHYKFEVGLFPWISTWQVQLLPPCARLEGCLGTGSTRDSVGLRSPRVTPVPRFLSPPCPPLPIGLHSRGIEEGSTSALGLSPSSCRSGDIPLVPRERGQGWLGLLRPHGSPRPRPGRGPNLGQLVRVG